MSEQMTGFWLHFLEDDVRAMARGELTPLVQAEAVEVLQRHDTHVAQCQSELDRKAKRRKKTA